MPELRSELLFRLTIALHPVQQAGETPAGVRRVFPVSGGTFEGPRLKGKILELAGSDWLLERADGAFQQDARLTLETDDGALILMSYRGVRHASPEISAKITRGEPVDKSQYYLRTAPFFETAAERYSWLNRIVSVGVGERVAGGAAYDVFEVL